MLILAIDSAGPVIGASLYNHSEDRTEGFWSARVVRGAERRFVPAVAELLDGRKPDLLAVSVGPGAFTSVRVGVATALGFAQGWQIPLITESTLKIRAASYPWQKKVLVLLDAKKEKVYGAWFNTENHIEPQLIGQEQDVDLKNLVDGCQDFFVTGEGVNAYRDYLLKLGAFIHPLWDQNPASYLAKLAALKAEREEFTLPEELKISYIRRPDAKTLAERALTS